MYTRGPLFYCNAPIYNIPKTSNHKIIIRCLMTMHNYWSTKKWQKSSRISDKFHIVADSIVHGNMANLLLYHIIMPHSVYNWSYNILQTYMRLYKHDSISYMDQTVMYTGVKQTWDESFSMKTKRYVGKR